MVPRVPFCRMAVGRLHLYDANAHERGKLLGAHRAVAVHEHDAGRRRRAGLEHHRLDIIVGRHTAVARKGRGEGLAFSFLVECIVCLDDLERKYLIFWNWKFPDFYYGPFQNIFVLKK